VTSSDQRLEKLLVAGPERIGYETPLWTCPRVAHLIDEEFNVRYHKAMSGKFWLALGWSPQRPEGRARERNEEQILNWKKNVWPALKKKRAEKVDPETGAILRTIESNRFVTGVTWVDGELWHGTWEGDDSDVRRIDPQTGEVLERLEMPAGVGVSGLESDGGDRFFCGGGASGKVRAVRRPKRGAAAGQTR